MKTANRGRTSVLGKMREVLSILTSGREKDFEEERKRSVLAFFLMMGIAITLPFAIYHFTLGNILRAILLLFVGSVQFASLVAFRYLERGIIIFRVNVILLGGYFLFLIIAGGIRGSGILWTLIFPLFSFFLLGKREGLLWSAVLFFFSLIVFMDPAAFFGTFPYGKDFKIRFLITYAAIVLMSHIVEATRRRYQVGMELTNLELEERVRQRTAELRNVNEKLKDEIRDRELAQQELQSSERRLSDIINFLPDATFVIDLDGKVIAWNHTMEELSGVKAGEMLGRGDFEYAIPFYGNRRPIMIDLALHWDEDWAKKYEYVKSVGTTLVSETRNLPFRKDPSLFWNTARPLYNAEGDVIGAIEVIRDITDRMLAEEALKGSEERFRTLVERSPLGVSLIGGDGRYRYVNPKFVELFGYGIEEISTGRKWMEKAYPDQELRREAITAWKQDFKVLKAGEMQHRSYRVACNDGSEKDITFRSMKLETGDVLVIYEDSTEQKRLEDQLMQAQKMEAIGTMAGGIAHDFNNLLMGIQGRASMMLTAMDSSNPFFEHITGIEEYVRSAADLTKQLLGFARGGKYEVKVTDMNELADQSASLFGRTKKEITIHRKFEPDLWTVEVDRSQIEQVLLNLFVNAWQAMPAGGEIYLQTRNVILDEGAFRPPGVKSGEFVKISVTDTGVGMDEQTKQRLFDPFFTTKGMGRGTGLGLASVYGIVKNHDGIITVYSEKGHGSTFNIYLPASGKALSEEKEIPAEVVKGKGLILLVDDEELILEVGRPMLETLGYKVLLARSGKEAIEVYKSNMDLIKLVILDMIMPHMSGGETFLQLKAINTEVKVLLSSGYSINGKAREILNLGCQGFIQKPFNLRELSQGLMEVLGGR